MLRTACLVLPAMVLPALASAQDAAGDGTATGGDAVVATVAGQDITATDLRVLLTTLPDQYRQLPPDVLLPGLIDQVVQQQALALTVEEVPAEVERELAAQRRSRIAALALTRHLDDAVTDEDVRAAYDEQVAEFEGAQEYDAAHILLESEEDALAAIEAIEGGADFAEVAEERSTGPSGPRGGALGWFGAGQMVPEFEAAVQALDGGEVSAPVQTQFGWHVIRLNGTRTATAPTFEEAEAEIRGRLQSEAVRDYVAEVEAATEIERTPIEELDPALLTSE
jgi:peptidyl-prolyl cis-trans isomerase C